MATNDMPVKTVVGTRSVPQKMIHWLTESLPAVFSDSTGEIMYVDRYEIKLRPFLSLGKMPVDKYLKLHKDGCIPEEKFRFGLELNKKLKEIERF